MRSLFGWLLILAALRFAGAVEPPIAGRPSTYTGGVGQFKVSAQMTTQDPTVGQPIVVELTMTGAGDWSRLKAPNLETAGRFNDDFVVADTAEVSTEHGKTFRYSLLARTSGRHRIPPVRVSFFNPATHRYETIASSSVELTVAAASIVPWSDISMPPAPAPRWPGYAVGGVVLGVVGVLVVRRRTSRVVRPKTTLRIEPMSESETLIDRLADHLQLPPGDRTTPEILAALTHRDLQGRLQRCLEQLDRRRFGPEKQVDDLPADIEALRLLIDQIVGL